MFARCALRVSVLAVLVVATAGITLAQDNWLGGTGNWSNGGFWSAGEPNAGSDVVIYSGGNDHVTLDVGATTINSLTLGGASNGYTSELTDGGIAQTLSITNSLTVGQNGELILSGRSNLGAGTLTVASGGYFNAQNGSTVTINGAVNNAGNLYTGYLSGGGNTLSITGTLTNQGGGQFLLGAFGSGPSDMATLGGLANSGTVEVAGGAPSRSTAMSPTRSPAFCTLRGAVQPAAC